MLKKCDICSKGAYVKIKEVLLCRACAEKLWEVLCKKDKKE